MQITRKIIVFALVVNVFLLPIYGYFIYQNFSAIIHQSEYQLKKVEIAKIINLSYHDENSSYVAYRATYSFIENEKYFRDSIDLGKGSIKFEHFMNAGGKDEVFEGNRPAKEKDSIWVWHNPKAIDYYTTGENDIFETKTFWLKIIAFIVLCLIALWSIHYHLQDRES